MSTIEKIQYHKTPFTIDQQVAQLQSRGLLIDNVNEAKSYLSNISYYRLRAYTYPFQDNDSSGSHRFLRPDIQFRDIIELYCFDRRLRSLIFNAIEKIEVALRTKITQIYAETTNNSHWYTDASLYRYSIDELLHHIKTDVERSNEDFIKHYHEKYNSPSLPPSWMTLEVVSMATLSRLFQALKSGKPDDRKQIITSQFGLKKIAILENWLHAISNLRNCCAHHSRVWNRRFMVSIALPYDTTTPFIPRDEIRSIRTNKLFAVLSCIAYILDIISPGSDFKTKIRELLKTPSPLINLNEMGFPANWHSFPVWRIK